MSVPRVPRMLCLWSLILNLILFFEPKISHWQLKQDSRKNKPRSTMISIPNRNQTETKPETQYGEKATYFQHSPLNSRTLVNHEPTMTTASPNIHQTAAVVSNWQALLVLFEIERKKSVKTQRETKLSPASWLERKVASKLCGRGQICFVKGGRECKNLNFVISLLISCTSQCRVSLSLWSRGQRISLSRAQFTSSFSIYFFCCVGPFMACSMEAHQVAGNRPRAWTTHHGYGWHVVFQVHT